MDAESCQSVRRGLAEMQAGLTKAMSAEGLTVDQWRTLHLAGVGLETRLNTGMDCETGSRALGGLIDAFEAGLQCNCD